MKNLVLATMSVALEIALWLNIVVCAIVGYNMGYGMGKHNIIGAIIGVLAGFFLDVFSGGFLLLLMEIRNDLKEIAVTNDAIKDYLKKITNENETATKNEATDTKKVSIDMDSLLRK